MVGSAAGDARDEEVAEASSPAADAGDPATVGSPPSADDRRDRRLVRRIRSGDERAFEELVALYQNRVFSLSLRMVGNRQEAEDLAQDVFLTVHRAIGSYRGEARFSTWLYRVATNTCRNRLKYLKRRHVGRSVSLDEEAAPLPTSEPRAEPPGQIAGPEAMAAGLRLESAIARELAALEPEHRLLIVLRDIQGLPYQEILGITGLQEGTLKSRLHRARVALKERLKPHLG